MNNESERITKLHLEIVVALMKVLENHLNIYFLMNWKKAGDNIFLFGYDEDVPEAPYLQLQILGGGGGDTYSGSFDYYEVFTLLNAFDKNEHKIRFSYDHMSTNLAGDCSLFSASFLSEDDLLKLETDFYLILRNGVQLPPHYEFLIGHKG